MTISPEKRKELDRNFEALSRNLNQYLPLHANKYASMRHGEVVEFFLSWEDAYKTGKLLYDDDLFSIQKVANRTEDLGFHSHALHSG